MAQRRKEAKKGGEKGQRKKNKVRKKCDRQRRSQEGEMDEEPDG